MVFDFNLVGTYVVVFRDGTRRMKESSYEGFNFPDGGSRDPKDYIPPVREVYQAGSWTVPDDEEYILPYIQVDLSLVDSITLVYTVETRY